LNDTDLPEYYYNSTWYGCTHPICPVHAWGVIIGVGTPVGRANWIIPVKYLPESQAIFKKAGKNIRPIFGFWGSIGAGVSR